MITMPKLSPTMEEGTIVKWHKKEGEQVEAGETLLEIATDKATVEHAALDPGYLRKILVPENGVAKVNDPIAIITATADESFDLPAKEEEAPVVEEKKESVKEERPVAALAQPSFVPEPPLTDYTFPKPSERVRATPAARALAREKHLDLSSVQGSGPGGRISKEDLAGAQSESLISSQPLPTTLPGTYEEEPLSPMRRVVGQRLQQSKSFIPHFYVSEDIDASPLVEVRSQLKNLGVKVTFNDLVTRATAFALRHHPEVNSGFNSETQSIIRFKTIDICTAVSLDGGLVTPVIRHADHKSLTHLSAEIKSLSKRARAGKLMPEEYRGGSFTISNLGMYGVADFVAVINPPQAAILAVAGINDRPVVRDGAIIPGKVLRLTVSADHRVVDGVDIAKFLVTLKRLLENPAGLL